MKLIAFTLLIALTSLAFGEAKPQKYLNTAYKQERDIIYKTVEDKALKLDVYHPAPSQTKNPVIFYTHGGGWAKGSKGNIATKGGAFSPMVEGGFCVVSISYRLYSKGGTTAMRDCVTDCKDAIRYIAKNHEKFNVDPNKFYIIGDSAGGQIAQMLLLTSPDEFPGEESLIGVDYKMIAGLSWYGPSSFEDVNLFNHDDRENFKDRFGPRILKPTDSPDDKDRLYAEMSAVNYLKKDSPPLLLIQGDSDTTIPVKHAYLMQKEADKIGAPVKSIIVKGSGHNWRKAGDSEISPSKSDVMKMTAQFFIDHKL